MPIQSRKNNNKYNKYNNNKYNKNKRTRKRPLQKGGETKIVDIKDLGPFVNLKENIQSFIRKNNLVFTNDLELIQIDDTIHFFTKEDADNFRNILEEFKQPRKPASDPIQLKEGSETDFTEKISEKFIKKPLIYVSSPETIYNLNLITTTGGYYTLFKFKTIEADNEAEAEIVSSVDTKVEVDKADKADSEQKKKLLHEANQILKNINNTDKGIKTYLNSKEYKDSEFKKLSVEFITQNPYITNDAINKLTFT